MRLLTAVLFSSVALASGCGGPREGGAKVEQKESGEVARAAAAKQEQDRAAQFSKEIKALFESAHLSTTDLQSIRQANPFQGIPEASAYRKRVVHTFELIESASDLASKERYSELPERFVEGFIDTHALWNEGLGKATDALLADKMERSKTYKRAYDVASGLAQVFAAGVEILVRFGGLDVRRKTCALLVAAHSPAQSDFVTARIVKTLEFAQASETDVEQKANLTAELDRLKAAQTAGASAK